MPEPLTPFIPLSAEHVGTADLPAPEPGQARGRAVPISRGVAPSDLPEPGAVAVYAIDPIGLVLAIVPLLEPAEVDGAPILRPCRLGRLDAGRGYSLPDPGPRVTSENRPGLGPEPFFERRAAGHRIGEKQQVLAYGTREQKRTFPLAPAITRSNVERSSPVAPTRRRNRPFMKYRLFPSGDQTGWLMLVIPWSPSRSTFRAPDPSAFISTRRDLPFAGMKTNARRSPFGDQHGP